MTVRHTKRILIATAIAFTLALPAGVAYAATRSGVDHGSTPVMSQQSTSWTVPYAAARPSVTSAATTQPNRARPATPGTGSYQSSGSAAGHDPQGSHVDNHGWDDHGWDNHGRGGDCHC